MTGAVHAATDGAIATVTLDNEPRLNALSTAMWRQLGKVFTALSADDSIRCVVLRGAGDKAFAAGADIAVFETERRDVVTAKQYAKVVHGVPHAHQVSSPLVLRQGGVDAHVSREYRPRTVRHGSYGLSEILRHSTNTSGLVCGVVLPNSIPPRPRSVNMRQTC